MPRHHPAEARVAARGFTLIELLVVMALLAITTGMVSLALRDPAANQLEQEAGRLASLLESARADSRATGLPATWEPRSTVEGQDFRFVGLPASSQLPTRWMTAGVAADVLGARSVVLGPEPIIGAQRILLRLDQQRLTLATDGLGPFVVSPSDDGTPAR